MTYNDNTDGYDDSVLLVMQSRLFEHPTRLENGILLEFSCMKITVNTYPVQVGLP